MQAGLPTGTNMHVQYRTVLYGSSTAAAYSHVTTPSGSTNKGELEHHQPNPNTQATQCTFLVITGHAGHPHV